MDLLAHRETREILFDYETADSGGTLLLVGLGEHNENLSDRSVRDEGLGTVQDVVTVLLIRRRQDAGGVASRLGLRQAKAGYPLAARDLRPVSYTHLRAHETRHDLVCRLLLEKKKTKRNGNDRA